MPLEFEEEKIKRNPADMPNFSGSGLPGFMVKKGLAKDTNDAYKKMVIVSIVFIILAIVITVVFSGPAHEPIYQ